MATRRNLCLNPALDIDITGWSGGSTPTRTSVTGFGRSWAAEYTAGTYASTAATATSAVTVGLSYTVSVYVRSNVFQVNSGNIYIEWINGGGSGFGYPAAGYTVPANTPTRASVTATAPSGAVACRAIVDGINFPISSGDFTMVLIEQTDTLGSYFDGNTASASWDGTPGLSSSTLTEGPTAVSSADTGSGADAATLAAVAASMDTGAGTDAGALAATLTAADPATAVEAATLAADISTAADTGTSVEVATVGLGASDAATAADAASLAASSPVADLAAATEAAIVTVRITAADTGTAVDNAHALVPGQDITIRLGPSRRGWSARTSRR